MEKVNIGYSLKNIPIPILHIYLLNLTIKIEDFLKRLRWKAFFFSKKNTNDENNDPTNTFGFASTNSPPSNKDLENFEQDLLDVVSTIKFSKKMDQFQQNLQKDIKHIHNSKKIFIQSDKTRNIYKLKPETYEKIIMNSITSNYKKDNYNTENTINNEAYNITNKLNINDRVGVINKKESYILLKDHKSNFNNNWTARLINPTKTEIGKISKIILEKINNNLKKTFGFQQWINTTEVIDWFKNIKNKEKATFIQFDIIDFYPSINEKMLDEAIVFAKQHTKITNQDINIIKQCRRTILKNNRDTWIKKNNNFDVPMGAFDSAELSDLIGLYILHTLTRFSFLNISDVGLYRDDGLILIRNSNGPKTNSTHKKLIKALKYVSFKIDITSNLKIVNC